MPAPAPLPTRAAQEPDYNDFEMFTSPKVLLPIPTDGTPVGTGPQLQRSGDGSLPEHVERPPSSSLPQPQPTHSHGEPTPQSLPTQSSQDQLDWEVPAKGTEGSDHQSGGKGKRRCAGCCGCCGLSRKWKWVIGVTATVVIIAILAGGIAGGLMDQTNNLHASGSYDPSDYDTLRDSEEARRLTALNWTDSANETRHAIFYQVKGALFLQQYYSDNNSWVSHNISADFWPQNLNVPSAKAGTPLAAAATPATRGSGTAFAAVLYYLNSDNEIRELVSRDGEGLGAWAYGEGHPARSAANWTQLTAAADFCDAAESGSGSGCRNAFCYAYQNRDQNVMLACGDNWDEPTQLDSAHPASALALVPLVSEQQGAGADGNNATATIAREMQLFHYTDTTVKLFHIWSNSSWDVEDKAILSSLESGDNPGWYGGTYNYKSLPQVLAAPAHGEADAFALAVTTNGYGQDLKGSWYTGGAWETRDRAVALVGGTSNSSIASRDKAGVAIDHAGFYYAALEMDWVICQYAWSADDPFTLTYVADIDIWEPCLSENIDGC
ncbi:hypothetical protein SLS62_003280 [Diatrype stigma]|uniref:Fucose-specific lectin n=1 Tax=Diatrype stigma TaxID=117547 RepID=A0AAN9UWR7_9PEZI